MHNNYIPVYIYMRANELDLIAPKDVYISPFLHMNTISWQFLIFLWHNNSFNFANIFIMIIPYRPDKKSTSVPCMADVKLELGREGGNE